MTVSGGSDEIDAAGTVLIPATTHGQDVTPK
jgi:hypothetical protein